MERMPGADDEACAESYLNAHCSQSEYRVNGNTRALLDAVGVKT